jgi:hypothetical protein
MDGYPEVKMRKVMSRKKDDKVDDDKEMLIMTSRACSSEGGGMLRGSIYRHKSAREARFSRPAWLIQLARGLGSLPGSLPPRDCE